VADPQTTDSPAPAKRRPWRAMLLVVIVTAVAIWLVPSQHQTPVDLPTPPAAEVTATPATPQMAVAAPGSTARRLIAEQRRAGKPDPDAAYQAARQLAAKGQADDAYLLDFYAARLGQAEAAFTLAEQADPAHWQAGGPLKAPVPAQALKWYRAAAESGHPEASARLAALRAWTEAAARRGDAAAQRLMLAWQ
jgi:TPR repeat protein